MPRNSKHVLPDGYNLCASQAQDFLSTADKCCNALSAPNLNESLAFTLNCVVVVVGCSWNTCQTNGQTNKQSTNQAITHTRPQTRTQHIHTRTLTRTRAHARTHILTQREREEREREREKERERERQRER